MHLLFYYLFMYYFCDSFQDIGKKVYNLKEKDLKASGRLTITLAFIMNAFGSLRLKRHLLLGVGFCFFPWELPFAYSVYDIGGP